MRICDSLHTYSASLPLRKQMLIRVHDARLNMEATYYYKNFYSSSFAQPLPEAHRLEAMNAMINANENGRLYCTLALLLNSRFCWQNQDHFDLQFSIGARSRRRARASGQSMN